MEIFEVGPCKSSYQMGYQIGEKFSSIIKSRLANDLILQTQLRPFSTSHLGKQLLDSLSDNNRNRFSFYWDELVGIAEGSNVPVLDVCFNVILSCFGTKWNFTKHNACIRKKFMKVLFFFWCR